MNDTSKVSSLSKIMELPKGFYPTPEHLADRMSEKIDFEKVKTILEPSAGKGDLIKSISRVAQKTRTLNYNGWTHEYSYDPKDFDVDCIENDVNLRQMLQYYVVDKNYMREIQCWAEKLTGKHMYNWQFWEQKLENKEQNDEFNQLKKEYEALQIDNVRIVGDDFLNYHTYKHYDCIIMNPPFEDGAKHLLRAIQMQEKGGQIVCLLNAETIKNPYTNERKLLLQKLNEYEAEIEYITDTFLNWDDVERKTEVEVALINIEIPTVQRDSKIFEELRKAKQVKEKEYADVQELTTGDFIENIVNQYNMEVEATLKLADEYNAMKPYLKISFDTEAYGAGEPLVSLKLGSGGGSLDDFSVNKYLRMVRHKYWNELFRNKEFTGRLTSEMQKSYRDSVDKMTDYDFSVYNIKTVQIDMTNKVVDGLDRAIYSLFEELSEKHSWYPETEKNIHYYNGWATNKAYKINKKVIVPINGMCSTNCWNVKEFKDYAISPVLSDMEKVFDYLGGDKTDIQLAKQITGAIECGEIRKIHLNYFDITLYKKGTCHITFTDQKVLDKLNIYGSRRKGWLPPCYGKKAYKDMSKEEQAVIDDFQGADEYDNVYRNADEYLIDKSSLLMIAAPAV